MFKKVLRNIMFKNVLRMLRMLRINLLRMFGGGGTEQFSC